MNKSTAYHYFLSLLIVLSMGTGVCAQKVVVFALEGAEEPQDTVVFEVRPSGVDGFGNIPVRTRRWNAEMIGRERAFPLCGRLDLSNQGIGQLPLKYKGQKHYSFLDLSGNPIKSIRYGKLGAVVADTLIFRDCAITKWNRKSLPLYVLYLDLSENLLETIPPDISDMYSLFYLDLSNNQLQSVSVVFPEFLRCLDLGDNDISKLSTRSLKVCEESLENLNLSDNSLRKIPPAVRRCESLEVLNLKGNELTRFNCAPRQFPHLQSLDLRNNAFTRVAVEQLKRTWSHVELLIDEPLADE